MDEMQQIKQMVDESWRAFLTFAARGSGELGKECLLRFDEKVQKQARDMGPDGKRWFDLVEEQRGLIFDEYSKDPAALKRRLGVPGAGSPRGRGHSSGLADVAVRTAVRATVWQSIAALFRMTR